MIKRSIEILKNCPEIISSGELVKKGIHSMDLYKLEEMNLIESIAKGRWRIKEYGDLENPDWVSVCSYSSRSVICLISALSYYDLTTEIPHKVYIALLKGSRVPKIDYPPISVHHFSKESYEVGIETINMNGLDIKIFDIEKTIIDCFKFRNKIGIDVGLEALKLYKQRGNIKLNKLLEYSKTCRVSNVIIPYLEML